MLGFNKYLNKLYELKWEFNEDDKNILEEILLVEFDKKNNIYIIKNVIYTYIDILLGLEELDFTLTKSGEDCVIKIIDIKGDSV